MGCVLYASELAKCKKNKRLKGWARYLYPASIISCLTGKNTQRCHLEREHWTRLLLLLAAVISLFHSCVTSWLIALAIYLPVKQNDCAQAGRCVRRQTGSNLFVWAEWDNWMCLLKALRLPHVQDFYFLRQSLWLIDCYQDVTKLSITKLLRE